MNFDKVARQIKASINLIGIDLEDQNVLTEAGSGPFLVTPVIAAMAGANNVIACTRDSQWGTSDEIKTNLKKLAEKLDVWKKIELTTENPSLKAKDIDIVTNLGFVRPISKQLIESLPSYAAISLMWEPWEFRSSDIDLKESKKNKIPIIATNESHPHLKTFKSVALLAVKLLLEQSCEILGTEILVIGSNPFGGACVTLLEELGANVSSLDPTLHWPLSIDESKLKRLDAIVILEHRIHKEILGKTTPEICNCISDSQIPIIHICGSVDQSYLKSLNISKYPSADVPPGYMTVTTSYLGYKPVIALHTAGLHVGSLVSRHRKKGCSIENSISYAIDSGYGLALSFQPTSIHP
jgi:hypothetical protein